MIPANDFSFHPNPKSYTTKTKKAVRSLHEAHDFLIH